MIAIERPRPLRDPTIPEPDESLRGLFARAIVAHHLPNAWAILKVVGGEHRNRVNLSEDERLDPAELARILRTPLDELEARRYPRTIARNRLFFGMEICEYRIENRSRRFSPNALAKAPYARAVWELRDLPYCKVGWDMLTDRCVDCRERTRQGWTRPNGVDRCDSCGRPLAAMKTAPVAFELRDDLRLASDLADPIPAVRQAALARLHPMIGVDEKRGELFATTMRIRNMISAAPDPARDVAALHAACRALLRWPEGIDDLVPAPAVSEGRWSAAADAYLALSRAPADEASGGNVAKIGWEAPLLSAASPRIAIEMRRTGDLIGIRQAYELARTSDDTLRYGMDSGRLPFVLSRRGAKEVPMMVPADVLAFAREWHRRRSPGPVGRRLGIGPAAVEAIAGDELLPDRGMRRPGEAPHFLDDDVDLLIARLEKAASRTGDDRDLPLLTAVMIVHGRLKPWASIVRAMLCGTLPFRLVDGDGPVLGRSMIDRRRLHLIGAMHDREPTSDRKAPPMLQQLEAMHTLNTTKSYVLDELTPIGNKPRCYATADVLALGAAGMTAGEWALRRGIGVHAAWRILCHSGIPRVAKGLFARVAAETLP
ncbi:hypothetical protein [Sphingomonas panni]|uniref:hypothetical protein n=1 Tax=Sphingomonas panni TaxID=237612 RepID=UPI001F5B9905|nr:hypothetical protein [Sphingomonas panni]